jgi:acetyltransferase-like isoleucine patch superfamily enzyme
MENVVADVREIGEGARIASSAVVKAPKVIIGRNVVIDERVKIICKHEIVLGDNVYVGNDCAIILKSFSIGEYTKLHNHSLLNGKGSVHIGDNCWIGQNCVLNGEDILTIGNNVGIGTYSSVWTHGYYGQLVEGCQIFSIKPTTIEDDAWLVGSYNTVFPGVTIGSKAVLMGTSVVTKSLESNRVYSGNPARDITDKVGVPFVPINYSEKRAIILKFLRDSFTDNNKSYSEIENGLDVHGVGRILFDTYDKSDSKTEAVVFQEEVIDWSLAQNISKFCLTSKEYQKNYTEIERLVKTVLNPAAARFVTHKS